MSNNLIPSLWPQQTTFIKLNQLYKVNQPSSTNLCKSKPFEGTCSCKVWKQLYDALHLNWAHRWVHSNWTNVKIKKLTGLKKSVPQFPFSQQSLCNVSDSPKRPDANSVSSGQPHFVVFLPTIEHYPNKPIGGIPEGTLLFGPPVCGAGIGGWYSASERTLFLFFFKVLFLGQSSSSPLSREDGGPGGMFGKYYLAVNKKGNSPKCRRNSRKKWWRTEEVLLNSSQSSAKWCQVVLTH